MMHSVYTPLSGALAQERLLDVVANNLANVNTTGFKEQGMSFQLAPPEPDKHYVDPLPPANYKISLDDILPLHGNDHSYVGVGEMFRDDSQGPAQNTGNPLDMMMEGKGYFVLQTLEGQRLTRAGNFSLTADGALSDKFGNPVMGEKGTIFVRANHFEVNPLGEVYQDGELVDRLKVVTVKEPRQLENVGANMFYFSGPPENLEKVASPTVRQGFLEGSNVNAIKNLTAMIVAHRSYEAYQKAIKNYDGMMDKGSNAIGAVRA